VEIITTHVNTDLDALASMVAARKLYPDAVMVFPGNLSRSVEAFMALHRDALDIKSARDIKPDPVERVILVDTKSPGRLANLAVLLERPGVEIHIYDHHPRETGDISGTVEVVEMIGAATTLLVEKIRERGLKVTPLEATILALGIYQDTGSLVFSSTTARDVDAVSYLLTNGANLAVVADFLDRPFTAGQRVLLRDLLSSAEHIQVNGVKLLIAKGNVDEFVGGLAVLTHKLADFERPDAVFTVVEMDDRVHVVARSSVPEVDVREILAVFGGRGHNAAASVSIKKAGVEEVTGRLMDAIRARVKPPVTAAAIMNSPVKTITPETVVNEAEKVMLRYGHTGLPVVRDDRLVGIVSRRDVEKAAHHGLGHAPVKAFMTTSLVSVGPETPASVVRDLMIEHDIGRLPVIENGRLVGIVTRTDVLRTLHGGGEPGRNQTVKTGRTRAMSPVNIRELMYSSLPAGYVEILKWASETASAMGARVYAAGGIVRDLLLGMECLDIDLVVEGDGIELARTLSRERQGRLREHPQFGTAKILFPNGKQVDVTTSRVEFYQYPAAMPQVEASSLHQDLYRRDFTINAMAVSLNKESFGDVVDFFGGREDLERGLIRVLHNLSFIEDPVRILRAVRFEKRYYMNVESHTLKLAKEAISNKMPARVSAERIWEELRHVFLEPRPGPVLARYIELRLWRFLFPGVEPQRVRPVLGEIARSVRTLRSWDVAEPGDIWMVYFLAVLHFSDWTVAAAVCGRYHLSKRQTNKVAAALGGWRNLLKNLQEPFEITLSELARQVKSLPVEIYPLILCYLTKNSARKRFQHVLAAICSNKLSINGKDLRLLGYKPGPQFNKAMEALWQARLDGAIRTRQEELNYVKEYLAESGGEMEIV